MYGTGNGKHNDNGTERVHRSQFSQRAVEYAVAQLLTLLGKTPEARYRQVAGALTKFAGDDENKRTVVEWIQRYVSPRACYEPSVRSGAA